MYREAVTSQVLAFVAAGMDHKRISSLTGVHPRTISRWRANPPLRAPAVHLDPAALIPTGARDSYSYLLGLYLGDGWVGRANRTWNFQLSLDSRYPEIVEMARGAITDVMPDRVVDLRGRRGSNLSILTCRSMNWPFLVPQHGPGRKHQRRIVLDQWQLAITRLDARPFVRGLIHSDGCRFVARQSRGGRIYEYPRYCFRNYSKDIIEIFCTHLNTLQVEWTLSSPSQVQVAKRESVAGLDRFVGPKR